MKIQEVEYFKKEGEVNYFKCCLELSELRREKCLLSLIIYMLLVILIRFDLVERGRQKLDQKG